MTKPPSPPPPPPLSSPTLQPAARRNRASNPPKLVRVLRSLLRSLPILAPASACRFPSPLPPSHPHSSARATGTLFGHRHARISLSIQDHSRRMPFLVLELTVPTARFMQDMGAGLLRAAFECEKRAGDRGRLLDERVWCAFVNGRRIGYAQRREPSEADVHVLQLLYAVSTGAGVLPPHASGGNEGELTYMRAHFDRVVGGRDSETFYMHNPEGDGGPELTIFFVRI